MPSRIRFFIQSPKGSIIEGKKARVLIHAILRMVGIESQESPLVKHLQLVSKNLPDGYTLWCFRVPRYTQVHSTEFYQTISKLKKLETTNHMRIW